MENLWAYIAGFFDGEGCVVNAKKNIHLTSSQAGDIGKELLDKLKNDTGMGTVYKIRKIIESHQQGYVWTISKRQEIRKFINNVLPYSFIKKEKMLLLLKTIGERNDETQWTEEENNFIRKNFLTESFRDISEELKRSHKSIRSRASFLKLRRGQGKRSKSGNERLSNTRKKLGLKTRLGVKLSEETKNKMRVAALRRYGKI
jgi:hypothetical protein